MERCRTSRTRRQAAVRALVSVTLVAAALACSASCRGSGSAAQRTFASPEDAVRALIGAVATENVADLLAMFAPEGQTLVELSDPAAARRRRQVFVAATLERWSLIDQSSSKILVVGNEQWPFPVPLVSERGRWRFDTAAGKEEIVARRIGRNELFVMAAGARYVAHATVPRLGTHAPYHGYYFRILTLSGEPTSPGGTGVAVIAWPADYDVTGVMTFMVGPDRTVHEKDLGAETTAAAKAMPRYAVDASWTLVR